MTIAGIKVSQEPAWTGGLTGSELLLLAVGSGSSWLSYKITITNFFKVMASLPDAGTPSPASQYRLSIYNNVTGAVGSVNLAALMQATTGALPVGGAVGQALFKTGAADYVAGWASIQVADVSGLAPSATIDTTNASNISSGALAAARLPAFGSADVSFAAGGGAGTIAANAVTYAKFQQVAASSLVGNPTGVLANVQGVTLGATLAFSGTALQTAAHTGDVTTAANSFATTIAANAVTNAKMATMPAHTIKQNATAGAAVPTDSTSLDGTILAASAFGPWTNIASAATTDLSTVTSIGATITGTTTITSFGTGANLHRVIQFAASLVVTHNGVSLIIPGAANITTAAGDVWGVQSDGSGNWTVLWVSRASGARELLSANRTYYVLKTGSDSNNGLSNTAEGAFLTVAKAASVVGTIDNSIYTVTISVGAGTFAESITLPKMVGAGACSITGAGSASTTINGISAAAFSNWTAGAMTLSGGSIGLYALAFARLNITSDIKFGTQSFAHMWAGSFAYLFCNVPYTITAGAPYHMAGDPQGVISMYNSGTITVSGTPAFGTAFAYAAFGMKIIAGSNIFSGAATGKRYDVSNNSIISTAGGGANYFPGSVAGTADATTGGYYT